MFGGVLEILIWFVFLVVGICFGLFFNGTSFLDSIQHDVFVDDKQLVISDSFYHDTTFKTFKTLFWARILFHYKMFESSVFSWEIYLIHMLVVCPAKDYIVKYAASLN